MSINTTGTISLAGTVVGQSIELELGGNGTTLISLNDAAVRSLAGAPTGAISIRALYGKTSVVYPGYSLWDFGANTFGQLGIGSVTGTSSPVQVGSGSIWSAVAGNGLATHFIKSDGTLWGAGSPSYLGNNSASSTVYTSTPVQVAGGIWKSMSAGGTGNLFAVRSDGTLWACGYNTNSILGDGTTVNKSSLVQAGSATTWSSTTVGSGVAFGIQTDGSLWVWGSDTVYGYGQNGTGSPSVTIPTAGTTRIGALNNWKQVTAANNGWTMAIKTDGTLWGWGYNSFGQLGNGGSASISSPIQVGSLTNWATVCGGNSNTFAVKTDGTLWGWGFNRYGVFGPGYTNNAIIRSPVQIGALSTWSKVDCRGDYWVGLQSNGTLWACGYSSAGGMGPGVPVGASVSSPVQIGSLTTWKNVFTDGGSTFGLI
jgi:alpha-tubulin suppressor-like RCC1 family protein